MKSIKLKPIPQFKSEKEERIFWQTHSSTEYIAYQKPSHMRFPNLKLTSEPITIRIPKGLLDRIKIKAHRLDVPYQSYIKQILASAM
ncbi:BrnA antitoxin family protein [Candidatus Roizmanbacteria bacterium]|nr:BrnA antitoxin family protein [Candidatus Roizmanbacteria bacterium]